MENQLRLVEALLERTRRGVLDWQATAEDDEFSVSFRSNSVRIARVGRGRYGPAYNIDIVNEKGQIIESFSNKDVDEVASLRFDPVASYQNMKDLFNGAKRRALGTDEALQEILEELGKER